MKSPAPLKGLRIVEFLGLGPAPFACMMLADLGADVVTLHRPNAEIPALVRNRIPMEVDLKDEGSLRLVRDAIRSADVLVEGFRPGVMERLGLGPADLATVNDRLIYARMTGWGQTGPAAPTAGHDINYIALSGALHSATRSGGVPTPPANLLGDFGGGAMYLVSSILSAVYERDRTGRGTVLDIGILDGTTYLTSMLHEYRSTGKWSDESGTNRLDTGAPYYDVYRCADGKFVAIGALEDSFFAVLLEILGLEPELAQGRHNPEVWPALRERIASAVATKTRDEWGEIAAPTDACLTPVLDLAESHGHPQVRDRGILEPDGRGGWTPRVPVGYSATATSSADLLRSWLGSAGRSRDLRPSAERL
ncbi:CaiB/BaiF CoA-transferase family protein [Rhodococcus sp. DMU1]|uniref:CaiB/BaiF CoA transferase family protein n=1 Tax=Rhodococcus sp. DMU1 TaxID=2722825 RepID=UPI0024A620B1|nr:CaiB/BaiF CoA-transferase family protein [Rhodococcus sp. DMU1]